MKNYLAATLAVSLFGCSLLPTDNPSPVADFQASGDWAPVPDPLITAGTLANGLDWYVKTLPDNGSRDRVELRLRIRAGSMEETDAERGLAHFVEHMAFNGTERFPKQDIVAFFEAAGMTFGGDINAHTSFHETVYKLTIPADNPELLETAFDVMVDWAQAVSFDPAEVAKEAPVVVEEWRGSYGTETPAWMLEYQSVYDGTRYADRLPIGDVETVSNATAEQLTGYYQRWYRPDNAEVIVVMPEGALDAQAAIRDNFSDWQDEAVPSRDWEAGTVSITQPRFRAVTDSNQDSHQWQLYLPSLSVDPATAAGREVDFIKQIYTSVLSARLQRLGEQDDAALIDAAAVADEFFDGTAQLDVWASVYSGKEEQALSQLTRELKRLQQYGLTESELEKAKRQLLTQYRNIDAWLEGAAAKDHADYLVYFLDQGLPLEDIDAAMAELEQMAEVITLDTVNEFIRSAYNADAVAGFYYYPKSESVENQNWEAIYAQAWQQPVDAPVDRQTAESGIDYIFDGGIAQQYDLLEQEGLYLWVLENGVTVVLKPSELEPKRANVLTLMLGGKRQLPDELIPAAEQWQEVRVRSGLFGLSGQDFFERVEIDGLGYSPFLADGYSGVDVSGPSEQLQTMLQMVAGTYTDDTVEEAMFNLTINSSAEYAAQYAQTPDYALHEAYLPAVYGDDVRYWQFDAETIQSITAEQVAAVQQTLLTSNQGMVVAIVGDVSPQDVTPLLRDHLAGLPLGQPQAPASLGPITDESKTLRIDGMAEEKTAIRYVFAAQNIPVDPAIYMTSEVAVEALQKRLHNAIREDSGLTYGTSVWDRPQYYFEQQWLLHIRLSTDPAREQEALEKLDATLAQALTEPFTDEEITEANHRVSEQYKQTLSTNAGMVNELVSTVLIGDDITRYDNPDLALADVSTDKVNGLVSQWLNGEKVVTVHHP